MHSGYSHPLLDGWVVATENVDILLDAYREEEEKREEKMARVSVFCCLFLEEYGRLQRVHETAVENWKRLTKSLMLRDRLTEKVARNDMTRSRKGVVADEILEEIIEHERAKVC